jgi:spore coat protein U domain-containing protein, fimbrial subunit CupE1/2/3/6
VRPQIFSLTVALLLAGLCGPVLAGQATTSFAVSATVQSSCAVSAGTLAFGNYAAATATPNDVSSTISVTCTSGLPYTVALDGGTTTATVNARAMTDGASHNLTYALYTTSGRTTLFGDGTSSTQTIGGTGSGAAQSVTVFGRIPVAQYVTAGSYTDSVGVTVNY